MSALRPGDRALVVAYGLDDFGCEIFTPIEDGCCACAGRPQFVQERRAGRMFWRCPACLGFFGEVGETSKPKETA